MGGRVGGWAAPAEVVVCLDPASPAGERMKIETERDRERERKHDTKNTVCAVLIKKVCIIVPVEYL